MEPAARILLCADDAAAVDEVKSALERAGHPVAGRRLDEAAPEGLSAHSLIVVDGSGREEDALQLCSRLRAQPIDGFIPILFLTDGQASAARLAGFENGADACLPRPFTPGELVAQVESLLRIKRMHDRQSEKGAEFHRINRRLQQAYQRVDQELELARRIQQSLLPQLLPEVPRARFAVQYLPCGRVGGDFYDVFRLDEKHVGFYVADAMGHGVPASLLTIYLKKGVQAKEISGKQYRLVPPNEVLQRLNRELMELGLSEYSFITMAYGLFDCQEGVLRFARAGHPHPLYISPESAPVLWRSEGPLLGVFEAAFTVQTYPLQPGDKVLFCTDGADGVAFEGHLPGMDSLLACAARHKTLPVKELVERLSEDLFRNINPQDDFTLLGLERTG